MRPADFTRYAVLKRAPNVKRKEKRGQIYLLAVGKGSQRETKTNLPLFYPILSSHGLTYVYDRYILIL